MKCVICGKEFQSTCKKTKCCSPGCTSVLGGMTKRQRSLEKWLKDGNLDYKQNTMIKVSSIYREYIQNEQDNKCAICGIPNIWNNKNLVFVLDHIDGDSSNHNRNNLRLVCPNCDSQLPTYKSKNKKSHRDYMVSKK